MLCCLFAVVVGFPDCYVVGYLLVIVSVICCCLDLVGVLLLICV